MKNILYLTDFSEPSEAALPFASTLGRGYGAKVHALHVLIPASYVYMPPGLALRRSIAAEENAQAEMQRWNLGLLDWNTQRWWKEELRSGPPCGEPSKKTILS